MPMFIPECSQFDDDWFLDSPGLQGWLGRGGEPNGGVLQSDDLRLLQELLQVQLRFLLYSKQLLL